MFLVRYTYEVAPVFTLMEREVIERSLELVGYPPMPQADGIMCPGGSMSNIYAMVLARYVKIPDVKMNGVSRQPPLACFTSESSHYSILKGAHWLGIGINNVYKVQLIIHFHDTRQIAGCKIQTAPGIDIGIPSAMFPNRVCFSRITRHTHTRIKKIDRLC